jgi:hypothetical protein
LWTTTLNVVVADYVSPDNLPVSMNAYVPILAVFDELTVKILVEASNEKIES